MKIIRKGEIFYDGETVIFRGWTFDCEGKSVDLDKFVEKSLKYAQKRAKKGFISNNVINSCKMEEK